MHPIQRAGAPKIPNPGVWSLCGDCGGRPQPRSGLTGSPASVPSVLGTGPRSVDAGSGGDAGIGDEQLERLAAEPPRKGFERGKIAHVQRLNLDAKRLKLRAVATHGCDHPPAVDGILAGEFEADPTARAGD